MKLSEIAQSMVTAAVGAAARLGVSLTHRKLARTLHLLTVHSRAGGLSQDVATRRTADPRSTLMFYMATGTGPQAAQRLLEEGLSPDRPAIIMAAVSRPGAVAPSRVTEALAAAAPCKQALAVRRTFGALVRSGDVLDPGQGGDGARQAECRDRQKRDLPQSLGVDAVFQGPAAVRVGRAL